MGGVNKQDSILNDFELTLLLNSSNIKKTYIK